MKYLIAFAFTVSTALAAPGMIVSSASGQGFCGPDASAGHLRPGGFCGNANSGKSLTGPVDEGCTTYEFLSGSIFDVTAEGKRVHVAVTCDCAAFYQGTRLIDVQPGDRIHMAQEIPRECQN